MTTNDAQRSVEMFVQMQGPRVIISYRINGNHLLVQYTTTAGKTFTVELDAFGNATH